MATEIERKFLVADDSWRDQVTHSQVFKQGYLASNEKSSVRVRIAGAHAWLNLKGATLGQSRLEFEYEIPVEDAEQILENLCDRPYIEKTRYYVEHAGHTWEIDEFAGDNAGLIMAEVELNSENERISLPTWIGKEVTEDPRYYNACLVKQPFNTW